MKKIVTLFLFLSSYALVANESRIYSKQRDSSWFPLTYVITGSFDVIQNPYWFNQKNASAKYEEVWKRIRDPHHNIKRDGGYDQFFRDEFFSSRVIPNIALHFMGGAHDTLWLTEYFRDKNYPLPKAFAFLITYLAHIGNEAFETSSDQISSHDHIADIYFFDLAAFYAASNPAVMNFLLDDLQMKAWHFHPMYDVKSDDIFNAGLNYVIRPKILQIKATQLRPMVFFGMQNMLGLSYDYDKSQTFSMAMGLSLTDPLRQKGRFVTALFHENENEIEAALLLNGSENMRIRLNLYENLFYRIVDRAWKFNLVIGQKKSDDIAIGLSWNMPLGIGFID